MHRFVSESARAVYERLESLSLSPPAKVHLIGIGGTGMGTLACLLQAQGFDVRGSDGPLYPPMSDILAGASIEAMAGYDPANLDWKPDLVVVGNVCSPDHVEAVAAAERGLARSSLPDALQRLFLRGRHPIVVAGTHGKTTATSLLAWLLHEAGRDPGIFVGGVPANFGHSFRVGAGPHVVVEGDEYDSAYFDKQAKFLHYSPESLLVTSVEFDHGDIYPNLAAIEGAFARLIALLPDEGQLVYWADDERVRSLAAAAPCRTLGYGTGPHADLRLIALSQGPAGLGFGLEYRGQRLGPYRLPMSGRYNALNAAGAIGVLLGLGLTPAQATAGLPSFAGVKRRQEERGVADGVRVIDDFAHHPTAVSETLAGLRARYPDGRLWAVFEPRSNTSRTSRFEQEFERAFGLADAVVLAKPHRYDLMSPEERLDTPGIAARLRSAGRHAAALDTVDEIVAQLVTHAEPGDTVAVLSNGGFGGIHDKLLAALAQRAIARKE